MVAGIHVFTTSTTSPRNKGVDGRDKRTSPAMTTETSFERNKLKGNPAPTDQRWPAHRLRRLQPPVDFCLRLLHFRFRACWDSGFTYELDCDSSFGWTDSF
jgi:hypothetical protein